MDYLPTLWLIYLQFQDYFVILCPNGNTMKKMQRKHEAHMLTYAIANDGRFVNVDDVKTGQECCCFCPACKEPLVAKNKGMVRVHHFAHQSGTECDLAYESMLHLLAKEHIQYTFLNSDHFYLDFEYRSYCPNDEKCKFVKNGSCYSSERKRFNLKDFYDSCEQEVAYDGNKRRSDLKLFSSINPQRPPIYIEFCVTHASEKQKLHSGNRIIECIIEDESDIDRIIENGFVENTQIADEYERSCQMGIQTFGFANSDKNNTLMNTEIEFSRYVLFNSGKSRCFQDYCNCKELRRSSPYSLFEVCFHTPVAFDIYEYAKYLGYDKFHIPNCLLCKNYVMGFSGMGMICKNYRHLQIPLNEKFDTSRAKQCPCYIFNKEEHDQMIQKGTDAPIDEL